MKVSSLKRALAYRNPQILHKFVERFDISLEDCAEIFTETKKWLWLNAQPDAPRLMITGEMMILDEMWHTFVLFTRQYDRYCTSNFGRFLHHRPTTRREKDKMQAEMTRDPAGFQRRRLGALARQYEFVYDRLGPDTVLRWYAEYPRKYDRSFFEQSSRLPPAPDPGPEIRARLGALLEPGVRIPPA